MGDIKDWVCERCGHESSSKSNLLTHLRKKKPCDTELSHISREEYIAELLHRDYNDKTYNCEYCNTRFNSRSNKSRHKKTCQAKKDLEGINDVVRQSERIDEISSKVATLEQQNGQTSSLLQIQNSQLLMQLQETNKTVKELQNVVRNLAGNKSHDPSQESEPSTFTKKKKVKIPQAKRILCWNTYIGDTIGKTKCLCCKILDITQFSFNCGHVISDANGGDISIENLRPICDKCNTDMGTMDMREFALTHFNNIL